MSFTINPCIPVKVFNASEVMKKSTTEYRTKRNNSSLTQWNNKYILKVFILYFKIVTLCKILNKDYNNK